LKRGGRGIWSTAKGDNSVLPREGIKTPKRSAMDDEKRNKESAWIKLLISRTR